jgi:hypothetical protein
MVTACCPEGDKIYVLDMDVGTITIGLEKNLHHVFENPMKSS